MHFFIKTRLSEHWGTRRTRVYSVRKPMRFGSQEKTYIWESSVHVYRVCTLYSTLTNKISDTILYCRTSPVRAMGPFAWTSGPRQFSKRMRQQIIINAISRLNTGKKCKLYQYFALNFHLVPPGYEAEQLNETILLSSLHYFNKLSSVIWYKSSKCKNDEVRGRWAILRECFLASCQDLTIRRDITRCGMRHLDQEWYTVITMGCTSDPQQLLICLKYV